jgi:hypothetical protein
MFIGIFIDGQTINPIFNKGYYYGVVDDPTLSKYIFLTFIANDGDSSIYILPYIAKNNRDLSKMHNRYIELFNISFNDSIDGNILYNYNWTIKGFDNYVYYTLENNVLSFSLNIASLDTNYLDIFEFKGVIKDSLKIESIVSSTDSTFNKSFLLLTYKDFQK